MIGLSWPLLWLACSPDKTDEVTTEDALQVLVDRVLVPSGIGEDDAVVHEVGHLDAGTVLAAAYSDLEEVLSEGTTLFLLDRTPDAGWSHDVTWIRIDDDGDLHDEVRDMFPEVDGVAFLPEHHAAAWGIDWEVIDPTSIDEDSELESWGDGGGSGSRRAAQDPCQPIGPKMAVTVSAGRMRATQHDEYNWRQLLGSRGFLVTSVRATPAKPQVGPTDVLAAIASAATSGPLDEFVIVYSGHGLPGGGTLAFGEERATGVVTLNDLVGSLAGIDTDKLTVVLASCYSGAIAEALPAALKAAGMEDTEIVVQAASQADKPAYIERGPPWGSAFMLRMHGAVASSPAADPIPWSTLSVPPFNADTRIGLMAQSPKTGAVERCRPEVLMQLDPVSNECLAGWVDSNAYTREVSLIGRGFGTETGTVEMQQESGNWVPVPTSYWSKDAILFNVPMRRDGFPASERSPNIQDVEDPGSASPEFGRYLVRVTNGEDYTSDVEPIAISFQIYDLVFPLLKVNGDFPDWSEAWHPLTPPSFWTNGPTIQVSQLVVSGVDAWPLENVPSLDFDQDQLHVTSARAQQIGTWSYELFPGVRNLATAYDQSYPDVQYYGFRAGFPDDNVQDTTWEFALVYD